MKPVIVLAYDGEFNVAHAIAALTQRHDAAVVTMTLDIGQARDVRATHDSALAGGAVRAHVFDGVDDFVRRCVLPALQSAPAAGPMFASRATLAYPLIGARLVEVARLENARIVAHGGGEELSAEVRALDPSLQVLTVDPSSFVSPGVQPRTIFTSARHLLQRPVADPEAARGIPAHLEIEFDDAVPVAVNGVSLSLAELMESLSLIGGQHGIGHAEAANAPGALVLDAAYRALNRRSGIVRIELLDGQQRVLPAEDHAPQLVNHA
jgi:argininosuccinate synthase